MRSWRGTQLKRSNDKRRQTRISQYLSGYAPVTHSTVPPVTQSIVPPVTQAMVRTATYSFADPIHQLQVPRRSPVSPPICQYSPSPVPISLPLVSRSPPFPCLYSPSPVPVSQPLGTKRTSEEDVFGIKKTMTEHDNQIHSLNSRIGVVEERNVFLEKENSFLRKNIISFEEKYDQVLVQLGEIRKLSTQPTNLTTLL